MLRFGTKKEQVQVCKQYLLLMPEDDELAKWELINQDELDRRVKENELHENCRLFPVGDEVKIRFERTTHLE